jgi:hypothetical protein
VEVTFVENWTRLFEFLDVRIKPVNMRFLWYLQYRRVCLEKYQSIAHCCILYTKRIFHDWCLITAVQFDHQGFCVRIMAGQVNTPGCAVSC